ncbi:MAG: hypothetical protein FWC89_04950 [Defluviitaleaceae bacterium]|nr:hypothetical protein [Defluviitaleaceae bacterium]
MDNFLENIFVTLGRHDNHIAIMTVYLSLATAIILLRFFAHLHLRAVLLAFKHEAKKPIEKIEDVGKIKHSLLKKAANEYVRVAKKAVTTIPTSQIVERAVSGLGFMGWKYTGLFPFIEAMEFGVLGIGLVLAVIFSEYASVYGLLGIIIFVAVRLFAAFFNVRQVRAQLSDNIILYLEREIGRFYATDSGGAILRLKNDLTEAIDKQAAAYTTTMNTISAKMSDTFSQVSQSMIGAAGSIGPIVATAMDEKLLNMNEMLTSTLHQWQDALKQTAEIQNAINSGAERLSFSSAKIQSASDLLATHMQGHSNALSEQLITLVSAISELKHGLQVLSESQEAVATQSAFIERNQKALETTIASYEASLQTLTQSIGDGIGTFINLHAQSSAQTINDAMKSNLNQLMSLIQSSQHNKN